MQNYFYYKKPYLKIEKNINAIENSKVLNIDIKLKIVMNLLMIIMLLIPIMVLIILH